MCMLVDCSCHGDYIKSPRSGDGGEKPGTEVEKTPTQSTVWGGGKKGEKEVGGHPTLPGLLHTRPLPCSGLGQCRLGLSMPS